MALSVGQTQQFNTVAGSSVSSSSITTQNAGSVFVIGVLAGAAVTINAPTDNKGNTYTSLGTSVLFQNATDGIMQIFACVNGTGGTGHVFTANVNTSTFIVAFLVEVIGADTTSPIEVYTTNQDFTSPFSVTSGTTTVNDELLISFVGSNGGGTNNAHAESTGFTIQAEQTDGTVNWVGAIATRIVTSTGTFTPSWTRTSTADMTVFIFGLKIASTELIANDAGQLFKLGQGNSSIKVGIFNLLEEILTKLSLTFIKQGNSNLIQADILKELNTFNKANLAGSVSNLQIKIQDSVNKISLENLVNLVNLKQELTATKDVTVVIIADIQQRLKIVNNSSYQKIVAILGTHPVFIEPIQQVLSIVGVPLNFSTTQILGVPGFNISILTKNEISVYEVEKQNFTFVLDILDCKANNVKRDDIFTLTNFGYQYTFKLDLNPEHDLTGWAKLNCNLIGIASA